MTFRIRAAPRSRLGHRWKSQSAGRATVLRAGSGLFFDRVSEGVTLSALRYNGVTQQSYLILNPDFFPNPPSASSLASGQQPQQLQIKDSALKAPRNYQANVGIERQINRVCG